MQDDSFEEALRCLAEECRYVNDLHGDGIYYNTEYYDVYYIPLSSRDIITSYEDVEPLLDDDEEE